MTPRYVVTSIDNSSVGVGGTSMNRGEFDHAASAIARAQQLVDDALRKLCASAKDANELMAHYMLRGAEVPMIYGEPRATFHAYQYARQKANELFPSERTPALPA